MKRAWLVLTLLAAACVDLDAPRPWSCQDTAECTGGWVCLQDNYCHDPSVGAEVPCAAQADCSGGWFCGQELKCRDPSKPGAFPCDNDSQCAAPWRCSTERRCVDLSAEPQPRAAPPPVDAATLRSPLAAPAELVRTAPVQLYSRGAQSCVAWESLLQRGGTVEYAQLEGCTNTNGFTFRHVRNFVPFAAPHTDVAVVRGTLLVTPAAGGAILLRPGRAALDVAPSFSGPGDRLVPLAWTEADGSPSGGFVLISPSEQAVIIGLDGGAHVLGAGILDVTARGDTFDAGSPVLLALRQTRGGEEVVQFGFPGEKESLVTDLSTVDGGSTPERRAIRLRQENARTAVTFEESPGIVARYGVSQVCSGAVCGDVAPMTSCNDSRTLPDFALPGANTVRLGCSSPDDEVDFLFDSVSGGPRAFFQARPARRSWGTSRGHLRQLPRGQLAWSSSLDGEWSDVLPARPQVLGVAGDALLAMHGPDLYEWREDAGVALGLALETRVAVGVVARPVAFMEDEAAVLLENGLAIGLEEDGGASYLYLLPVPPSLEGSITRKVPVPDGGAFIVSTGGALYAGLDDPDDPPLLAPTVRPAPGFPINEWALRPATDGGLLEGWAVANNRLFRITATTLSRWKSSEYPLTGIDPLSVWFSGDAALLGATSGEVLLLPSRVRVAPPLLEGVLSITGHCGAIFATTEDFVWEVQPGGGGAAQWRQVPSTALYRPMLHRSDHRLFAADEDGVVVELPDCR